MANKQLDPTEDSPQYVWASMFATKVPAHLLPMISQPASQKASWRDYQILIAVGINLAILIVGYFFTGIGDLKVDLAESKTSVEHIVSDISEVKSSIIRLDDKIERIEAKFDRRFDDLQRALAGAGLKVENPSLGSEPKPAD